jgi:hypothetical protein
MAATEGRVKGRTTVLITPGEMDEASERILELHRTEQ